jgi:hypothetical protein
MNGLEYRDNGFTSKHHRIETSSRKKMITWWISLEDCWLTYALRPSMAVFTARTNHYRDFIEVQLRLTIKAKRNSRLARPLWMIESIIYPSGYMQHSRGGLPINELRRWIPQGLCAPSTNLYFASFLSCPCVSLLCESQSRRELSAFRLL